MRIEKKFREACLECGLGKLLASLKNNELNAALESLMKSLEAKLGGVTITGEVSRIGQTVNISSKGGKEFLKRELVLDCSRYDQFSGEKHSNLISITFMQKHCMDLDSCRVGDKVEVSYAISGREWNGKVFNDIVGYKVEVLSASTVPQAPVAVQVQQPMPTQEASTNNELPF